MKSAIETQMDKNGYQKIVKSEKAEQFIKLPDWQFVDDLERKIHNSLKLGIGIKKLMGKAEIEKHIVIP